MMCTALETRKFAPRKRLLLPQFGEAKAKILLDAWVVS